MSLGRATVFFALSAFALVWGMPGVCVLRDDADVTSFTVEFTSFGVVDAGGGFWDVWVDGCGPRGEHGQPKLAGRILCVATPKECTVELAWTVEEWSAWRNVTPSPVGGEPRWGEYRLPRGGNARIAYDALVRGTRIVGVDVVPAQYDPSRGVRFAKRMRITLRHPNGVLEYDERLYHPVWAKLIKALVINPGAVCAPKRAHLANWNPSQGAELLVVAPSHFLPQIEPWVEWKLFMGMPTVVATTDTIGSSRSAIKSFIRSAYEGWELPPAYVLFVGDAEEVPTYDPYDDGLLDVGYCTLEGSDIFPEILPGRLSADNAVELETIVEKHLNYEARPDTTDDWYARAIGIVREEDCPYDGGPTDSSYLAAVGYAIDACAEAGFSLARMFTKCSGDNSSTVRPYISAGCNFVTYRGQAVHDWWSPFEGMLFLCPPHRRLPIIVSITCAMGSFQYDGYPCEDAVRCGSPDSTCGAVAFMGQAGISTNSLERSSLSKNIFVGFFEEKLNQISAAHLYGMIAMYNEFGETWASLVEYRCAALLGSPELSAWTAPIALPTVVAPAVIPVGHPIFDVAVFAEGSPVEGARVAFHADSLFAYFFTDSAGTAEAELELPPLPPSPVVMVVTGPNIYPVVETLTVVSGGVAAAVVGATLVEVCGNGDGIVNPGEVLSITPQVANWGDETADSSEVYIVVQSDDADITLVDSVSVCPRLAPGDTVNCDSVVVAISCDHPASSGIPLRACVHSGSLGTYDLRFPLQPEVVRFAPTVDTVIVLDSPPFGDGDGTAEVGECFGLAVWIACTTNADAYSAQGRLLGSEALCVLRPELVYNQILRGTGAEPSGAAFVALSTVAPPGAEIPLKLALTAHCSTYTQTDTLDLELRVAGSPENLPTGPDDYGYYIIDDGDILDEGVPVYEWDDIREVGEPVDGVTDSDDGIAAVALPFTLRFYGREYDTISISSNGILIPGVSDWSGPGTGTPQDFPYPGGPAGVIAALWCDLAPHREGADVYSFFDEENGQFVVQYDSVSLYPFPSRFQTFQIRICDAERYPTPTGDNEILILYKKINYIDVVQFGVGIESEDETCGLRYCLNGSYDAHAAPLVCGRALRITTRVPTYGRKPWLHFGGVFALSDSGDGDGAADPGERITVSILLRNDGNADALATSAVVLPTSVVEPATDEPASFGDIPTGGTGCNAGAPFELIISPSCPDDTTLMVPLVISAADGYIDTTAFPIELGEVVSVREGKPKGELWLAVLPNPFNFAAVVEVFVPRQSPASLVLRSIDGKLVRRVFSGVLPAGRHTLTVDGEGLPSGIYLVTARVGESRVTKKALMIK